MLQSLTPSRTTLAFVAQDVFRRSSGFQFVEFVQQAAIRNRSDASWRVIRSEEVIAGQRRT